LSKSPIELWLWDLVFRGKKATHSWGGRFALSAGANERGETRVSAVRFFQEYVQRSSNQVFAARSQFSLGTKFLGATGNDSGPDSRFLAWRGQAQYVRLLAPETLLIVRSDIQLADRPLLSLEQIGIGGVQSVRGYRQDLLLTDSGAIASAGANSGLACPGSRRIVANRSVYRFWGRVEPFGRKAES